MHACLGKEPEPQQEDHFCLKDGKPFNPLTEAGGVVVTDLLSRNQDVSECFERLDNKVYKKVGEVAC